MKPNANESLVLGNPNLEVTSAEDTNWMRATLNKLCEATEQQEDVDSETLSNRTQKQELEESPGPEVLANDPKAKPNGTVGCVNS